MLVSLPMGRCSSIISSWFYFCLLLPLLMQSRVVLKRRRCKERSPECWRRSSSNSMLIESRWVIVGNVIRLR